MSLEQSAVTAPHDARRLRILHVVPAYFPAVRYGGPIRSVHALSRALLQRGHEVSVFTTSIDGDKDLDVPLGAPILLDGVRVSYFRVPALRRLCWAPSLERQLRASIDRYDIVHLHSVYLWPTYAAARVAEKAGIPYVMSPRGMLVGDIIRRKNRLIKSAWIELVERRSLRHARALHVTAPIEGEEAVALGLKLPAIYCIPNGVAFPPDPPPLSAGPFADLDKPFALFLSRISWKKGLDRLIEAWRQVPDLRLLIAGNDEEGYQPRLQQMVQKAGLSGRIGFLGPIADEHKWALYAAAQMLVLPSYSENFGNVVAEAMAMGCPVVVTPEVGLARLVRDCGAGLVARGDPRAFARAVNELNQDELKRRRAGLAGRRAAAEHLSWQGVARMTEIMYREVLRQRSAPCGQ